MLILHYTGMISAQGAIDRLRDPAARVSSHYVVDEDGAVFCLVPEERRAWHAGVSFWRGRRGLNDFFNRHRNRQSRARMGLPPFSTRTDRRRNNAVPRHSGAAPHSAAQRGRPQRTSRRDRKQDPGELFPWEALAAAGIGIWPGGADAGTAPGGWDTDRVCKGLAMLGYGAAPSSETALATILRAFQRHWRPEAITGLPDVGTVTRLDRLLQCLLTPGRTP